MQVCVYYINNGIKEKNVYYKNFVFLLLSSELLAPKWLAPKWPAPKRPAPKWPTRKRLSQNVTCHAVKRDNRKNKSTLQLQGKRSLKMFP